MSKSNFFKDLFAIKPSERKWHMALLAGLCVGIPVLVGYFTGHTADGKLAAMAGLVILYLHDQPILERMVTLMACSFGIMASFTIGILAGFDPWWSPFFLGVFAFAVHLCLLYLGMAHPPGNLFFVLIASIAICMPFDLASVPHKIGLVGIGTMGSCLLGLIYSILTNQGKAPAGKKVTVLENTYVNIIESITFGLFMGISLFIGRLLHLDNPYWIPISCAAVMLGVSTEHVWQRSVQRVLGTLVGLILTWGILSLQPSPLFICLGIVVLQTVVEIIIVRNYAFAVVFISILTIFLAESGKVLTAHPNELIMARFIDIFIGSAAGAVGGWLIYNEKLQYAAAKQLRKTKVIITRRK